MKIKIINNEQITYLAKRDARTELNENENFSKNKYLKIPDEWFFQFDKGIKEILCKIKDRIQNSDFNRTEIDYYLFDMFNSMDLDTSLAASSTFWTSLTIQHDEAINLIRIRWNHEKNWFREDLSTINIENKKLTNIIRRYAGTDIDRQTFARIWWISKLGSEEKKEVIFKQQDFLDKVLMNRYILWNKKEGNSLVSRTMKFILDSLEEFDRKKEKYKEYSSIQRQDVTRQVFNWLKILNDTTVIELMSDADLKETIENFFEQAISIEMNQG